MIEVICGGMFAGKSELLIHRLKRASYAKKNIVAFKPAIDNRYSEEDIASHSGLKYKCVSITNPKEIYDYLTCNLIDVIGIDEAQFLSNEIEQVIKDIIHWNPYEIYIAGLDLDSSGNPFGSMPYLLSIADRVTKVSAVCVCCGKDATRSHRIAASDEQILVGAADSYEARCINCWSPK
jgi:thymidine kinase